MTLWAGHRGSECGSDIHLASVITEADSCILSSSSKGNTNVVQEVGEEREK
jgi:hypothetical protein